jgi:glycosyl-4,4'-diaponeurosporenoate acyltransferase
MTQMRLKHFNPQAWGFRKRNWEKEGRVYQKIFCVKKWKGLLPEGAVLFAKGFRKKELKEKNENYFRIFITETCRAECAHWLTMVFSPLFFLWNPFWVGVGMIVYSLMVNLPCIIAQRYNRIRLERVLKKTV